MATALVVPTGGAALIAVPIALETVGGAINTQISVDTLQWLKDHEFENFDDSVAGIDKVKYDGSRNAMTPLLNYAEETGMTASQVRDLVERAEGKYYDGGRLGGTEAARGW